MPRAARRLLAAVLITAAAGACGKGAGPAPPAAAPAAAAAPAGRTEAASEADVKRAVVTFLHNLPPDSRRVSADEVARTHPAVVDVRTDEEYARGAIAGAIHVELRMLASHLSALPPPHDDLVVVCERGYRGAIGMAVLQMLGYPRARSLEGGMAAWRTAGLPVVQPGDARGATGASREESVEPRVDPQLRSALEYYLTYTLPNDWGAMEIPDLAEDQQRKSSAEIEEQPETFDQGKSLLVVVEDRDEYARLKASRGARAALQKAIDLPLRELPDLLDTMPLQDTVNWA